MNLKTIITIFFFGLLLNACLPNKTLWVGGIKTECSAGAGKMQCLYVHKGESLGIESWENFYAPIEGFEFEEGVMKKIKVKEEKIGNPPADGASIRYTMVKELARKVDYRAQLNGDWTLQGINDSAIDKSIKRPNMKVNSVQMKVSGSGGCNSYSGLITKLTSNSISFGNIGSTRRSCAHNTIEHNYFKALNTAYTYIIKQDTLYFHNEKGYKILSYLKGIKKDPSPRIHDIWTAVRINKTPINRMMPIPRMEINLTEMKVLGTDGCNNYTGSIKDITDTQIAFEGLASTLKMCPEMETADAFNNAIRQVVSYRLENLYLILMNAEGNEVIAFLKAD